MAADLPPVDESVKIPDSVKAQAARADAFYAQPTPEQTPETPAAETAPTQSPEPEAPAPTPAPEPPAVDARLAKLEADLVKQINDNKALKGRFDQQRDMIAMQQAQLAQLSNPRSWANPDQQPKQPPQPKRLITEEERKAYGDEALSVMERKAIEVVQPVFEAVNKQNTELRQELQRVKAQDVYNTLDVEMPNWSDVNRDDGWKEWLRLPDLYSGIVRQQLLEQAFSAGDAGRILAFFRGFLAEHPEHMGQESPASQAALPPQAPVRKAAIKLESLAAPGRANPSPPPAATAAAPTITNKDVARFYWDVTHGRYDGRADAKAQREAQIHAAVREGRVQVVK